MIKWENVSAGPRQVKDLNRAIGKLRGEGTARDELYGVIGGEEHRSTTMALLSPCRPEVAALEQAIHAKHAGKVTRENVRAIIADFEAALPEARKSRPVEDSRRTPEQEAARLAAAAEREAREQAEQAGRDAVLSQVMAKAPAGAKALIVAEMHEDASDLQTDYVSSRTVRTVAIGWRFSSREDFRALRAAAARFPETAHMASVEALQAWTEAAGGARWRADHLEYRENYSMGSGNYLSDHGSARGGSGWVVRSVDLPCRWAHLTEDAIPDAAASIPASGGEGGPVTVSPSSLGRPGVVEVRFAEKPAAEVLAELKARGFRWARANRCWYGRDAEYAQTLAATAELVPA